MQAVLNGPNPETNPHVVNAFGANPNIPAIKDTVGKLENGRILVPHTDPDPKLTQGGTRTDNKHVTFGSTFYDDKATPPDQRAGTIIHEASHAIAGTVDHFQKDGKPYGFGEKLPDDRVKAGVQTGCSYTRPSGLAYTN